MLSKLFLLHLPPASVSAKLSHSVLSSEFSGARLHFFRIWQPLTDHFFLGKDEKSKKRRKKRTDPLPTSPAAAFLFAERDVVGGVNRSPQLLCWSCRHDWGLSQHKPAVNRGKTILGKANCIWKAGSVCPAEWLRSFIKVEHPLPSLQGHPLCPVRPLSQLGWQSYCYKIF